MIVPLVMPPPDILVPHYLMHCYLYYETGTSVISDHDFDLLAKELVAHWDEAKGHRHADIIDFNSLVACSSGYYIKYPLMVQGAAISLKRVVEEKHEYPSFYKDKPTLAEVYEK